MKKLIHLLSLFGAAALLLSGFPVSASPDFQQDIDPNPPDHPIKLIFVHHSTGENWLTDGYGNLGSQLAGNNYFVSDTNYGWGPDSIGDRTDIPDWIEWFASEQTPLYMDALFNESGQNSSYSRNAGDPGGENVIIMFKSCFPNSALEGNPDDPPNPDGWLSVGHAKYVYNQVLAYFSTRPDKLFIVITAPPLSDDTYADNARAFNQWLVNDWLDDNNYTLPNVAVFDFFNVLTAADAHHRYRDGLIEHAYTSSNTLAYPSGDDHPSKAGSRKASEEFIPLLNIFYNRWAGNQAISNPVTAQPQDSSAPLPENNQVPLPPETTQIIDDFESNSLDWEAVWDESGLTSIACSFETWTGNGETTALRIDFSVASGGWALCSALFDSPQDWSGGEWLAYDIHSEKAGLPFNEIIYGGSQDLMETYIHYRETPVEYPGGFIPFTSMWGDFLRVDWEANGGAIFQSPGHVIGLAFGFDGTNDGIFADTIWIDNIHLEKSPDYSQPGGQSADKPGISFPCLGIIILPFITFTSIYLIKLRK